MSVKPVAWMTPRIVESLKRAPEWEGEVAWHPTLIGDSAPVTDKHGVTHVPKPLYDAPVPELAEALQKLAAWDKKYPRSPIYCEHTFKKCEAELTAIVQEAISLLARITPK